MATAERNRDDMRPVLDENEAALAKSAQRCIMTALDHSRAPVIKLVAEDGDAPEVRLPPKALRLVAQVLGAMGERRPITIVPGKHELPTMEAAHLLNVSRPFVIKQIDEGHLACRMVGTHRRIAYRDLIAYKAAMSEQQQDALQALADDSQTYGDLGF